nr:hypothetical protein [Candidatus Mycoplasma haematolamae]
MIAWSPKVVFATLTGMGSVAGAGVGVDYGVKTGFFNKLLSNSSDSSSGLPATRVDGPASSSTATSTGSSEADVLSMSEEELQKVLKEENVNQFQVGEGLEAMEDDAFELDD